MANSKSEGENVRNSKWQIARQKGREKVRNSKWQIASQKGEYDSPPGSCPKSRAALSDLK